MTESQSIIPAERIAQQIVVLRGQKVMLDSDLAALYGVETGKLNRAVKRNPDRFPSDFMFQLTEVEFAECLQYQIGTAKRGGRRNLPHAFTEQGVAMLSSVLHTPRAIQVNVEIMRAFVHLRELLGTDKGLAQRLDELESRYDKQFRVVFEAIRDLMLPAAKPTRKIGFKPPEEAQAAKPKRTSKK